jgi:hypothetical protein
MRCGTVSPPVYQRLPISLDLLCVSVKKSEGPGLLVWEIVIERAGPGTAALGDGSHRCGLIADLCEEHRCNIQKIRKPPCYTLLLRLHSDRI